MCLYRAITNCRTGESVWRSANPVSYTHLDVYKRQLFILYNIRDFNETDVRTANLVGGSQSEMYKRDCDVETVYSVSDSQCQAVCKQPGIFSSRNGACINEMCIRDSG